MFKINEVGPIAPITIQDKESYIEALSNIEYSWTGRLDVMFSHTFFLEAVQLVRNAITLFEQGYFDCAFYSLRQALEICTTIVYFADDTDENRNIELSKWKHEHRFPMNQQMIKELEKRENVFAEMKDKMSDYFSEIDLVKQKLNKYVHKQGFDKFYISRAKSPHRDNLAKKLAGEFEYYLTKTIGAIAVFRLAVDPFPLLLMDDDIYNRTEQLMTEKYTNDFVEKFIGLEHCEKYKQTDLYIGYYNHFINEEKRNDTILDVIKDDFINRENLADINSQIHLLGQNAHICVMIISYSDRIAKIYYNGGLSSYFTEVHSKRLSWNLNSADFDNFKSINAKNAPYDEAYMTYIQVAKEDFFIEHNEPFSEKEYSDLVEMLNSYKWYPNPFS